MFVTLPTKAIKQNPPRAPWEPAAKAPKIKHTFPLIGTSSHRGVWPGGCEDSSDFMPECTHTHTQPIHTYTKVAHSPTQLTSRVRDLCGHKGLLSEGASLSLMLGSVLKFLV